jgi:hypothetical protein
MSKILEKLADQHEERIINVLYKLEEDVVKEVTRATKGQLVSQRLAIQLRPAIKKLIDESFLDEADTIINREYNKIAKEVLDRFGEMPIPSKFKSLTEVDLRTINALKYQSFSGFEDIAERFLKVINDEVYQSTIAGRPFEDMVSNIRSHINGVYKSSNSAEINELVDFINENKFDNAKKAQVEEAVRKLHTQYASDRAGNNLRRYASQIAHDSVMQFHGQFTVAKAKEAGLTHFTYTGTLVRDSREFCVGMLNRTLTEEQIREMWNRRSWQGKSTGDPFIVRGGYRCRHTWLPTDPAWGEEADEVPEETPVQPTTPPPVVDETDIFQPINREGVTEQTIKIVSANEATKRLNKIFNDASKDDRYLNKNKVHYSRQKVSDFGTIAGSKLDDDSLSMILALMPEAEQLCKKFNVPMIRGIRGSKNERSFLANMGDGTMGIQVQFAKRTSKNIGSKSVREARSKKIEQQLDKLLDEEVVLVKQLEKIYKEVGAETYYEFRRSTGITLVQLRAVQQLLKKKTKVKDKYNELNKLSTTSLHTEKSNWKRGDNLKDRPFSAKAFEDNNLDQFRATFYHEIGHHVHQQYKIKDIRVSPASGLEPEWTQVERPLEKRLNKVKNIKEHSPSGYGTTNTKEWFVENFSLYYRGKEDLVAPEFLKLLQEIKDDKIP